MINPRPAPLVLTDGERARLAAWAGDPSAGPLAQRARIVLACADGPPAGRPVARVAAELGLSRDTVRKWRSRFLAMRLAGLRDAPRPGAPRTITDEQMAGVIARLLLEAPPASRRRWSTRLMAAETGMSQSAVSRIWRQAGLSDPGRLDLTRIGDNDRMGSMQAGFQPHDPAPEPPVPGERIPGQRVSAEGLPGQQAGFAAVAAPELEEGREGMRAQEDVSAVRPAGPAEGADGQRADLPPDRYFDREESWLRFNQRVLELAEDETLPLLERVRFLSIFASNLDEFFMVRVAGRMRRMATGLPVESMTGRPPERGPDQHPGHGPRAQPPARRGLRPLGPARPGRRGHRDPALEGAVRGRAGGSAAAVPGADLPGAHPAGRGPGPPVPVHLRPVAQPGGDGRRPAHRRRPCSPG